MECMTLLESLPKCIQLTVVTMLLIISLVLYDAPFMSLDAPNGLIVFLVFRGIAFLGIVFDIYLMIKLIPIESQKESESKLSPNINPLHFRSSIPIQTAFDGEGAVTAEPQMTASSTWNEGRCDDERSLNDDEGDDSMEINRGIGCIPSHYALRRRRIVHRQRVQSMMETQKKRRDRALRTAEMKQQRVRRRKRTQRLSSNRSDGGRTRIDLRNDTKLSIATHYLEHKRADRGYDARECRKEFLAQNVECGRLENIWKWSRSRRVIEHNIARYGPQKKRNRPRKSWFDDMEMALQRVIAQKVRRGDSDSDKITNQWIQDRAKQIHHQMYPDREFKASDGWLRNFKQRHPELF